MENIGTFVVSANGEKALYEQLPPRSPMAGGGGPPPHGTWIIKVELANPAEVNALLDAAAYEAFIAEETAS